MANEKILNYVFGRVYVIETWLNIKALANIGGVYFLNENAENSPWMKIQLSDDLVIGMLHFVKMLELTLPV